MVAVEGAARPPDEARPRNLWELIFAVVDSNRRTRNAAVLAIILGGVVVVATKGVHIHPVCGDVFGYVVSTVAGATGTYAVKAWRNDRARRRAAAAASAVADVVATTLEVAAAVDPPSAERSPGQSHTPAPPEPRPGPPRQPRRRSGQSRRRRSSGPPQQPSP
jgi:hypothetical protein